MIARLWRLPLVAHVAALTIVIVALFPLMSVDSSFTSDEGAYALQARANADGRDDYRYKAQRFDPDGRWFPIIMSQRGPNGWFTYSQHPLYPRLQAALIDVGGEEFGLHALSALGAVGAAAAAWLLAREVDERASRAAFWLAALSPVLANGYLLWAHALSAAVSGFTILAAVRVGRYGWARPEGAALVAGVAAGAFLRSEGLLFGVACAVVVGWLARRRSGLVVGGVSAAVPVVVAAGSYLAEREWIGSLLGGNVAAPERLAGESFIGGRLRGAWHVLVQGAYDDRRVGLIIVVALIVLMVMAVPALRRGRGSAIRDAVVAIGVAVTLYLARWAIIRRDPITGFLAAWPAALLGVAVAPWRRVSDEVRVLAAGSGLFLAVVLATQYAVGGGLEWGGRFLSPLIVPAAVLAAVGLQTYFRVLEDRDRRRVAVAVTALTVVPAVMALGVVGALRDRQGDQVAAVGRHVSAYTVTDVPALPRVGWSLDDDTGWLLVPPGDLDEALGALASGGVSRVTAVLAESDALAVARLADVGERREPALNRAGIRVFVLANIRS